MSYTAKSYEQDPGLVDKPRSALPARAIAVVANSLGFNTTAERVEQHTLYKAARRVKVAADYAKPLFKTVQYAAEAGAAGVGVAVPGSIDALAKLAKVAATGFAHRAVDAAEAKQLAKRSQQSTFVGPEQAGRTRAAGLRLAHDII